MNFNFTKETPVANRKWIEEKDIADFQAIAAAGISEQLQRSKGIESTEKIARSPNTKGLL